MPVHLLGGLTRDVADGAGPALPRYTIYTPDITEADENVPDTDAEELKPVLLPPEEED